jgi:hypothetical protein
MTKDNDLVKRLRLKRERCHDLSGVYYTEDEDCQAAADHIEALEAELHLMKTSGVAEVAVRNPSVMEYMKHWEGRAEAAEAKLAKNEALIQAGFAEYERRLAEAEQTGYANAMEAERKLHEARIAALVANLAKMLEIVRRHDTGDMRREVMEARRILEKLEDVMKGDTDA